MLIYSHYLCLNVGYIVVKKEVHTLILTAQWIHSKLFEFIELWGYIAMTTIELLHSCTWVVNFKWWQSKHQFLFHFAMIYHSVSSHFAIYMHQLFLHNWCVILKGFDCFSKGFEHCFLGFGMNIKCKYKHELKIWFVILWQSSIHGL